MKNICILFKHVPLSQSHSRGHFRAKRVLEGMLGRGEELENSDAKKQAWETGVEEERRIWELNVSQGSIL